MQQLIQKDIRKRDTLYNHLVSLGFECIKPQGAFYLFPKSPVDDKELRVEQQNTIYLFQAQDLDVRDISDSLIA